MKDVLKNLEYFIGRPVTIITTPINRNFDEVQRIAYFVGVVSSVDSLGIMTKHPITGCQNYYFYSQICAISEEQTLNPAIPEEAKLIEDIKKKRQPESKPKTPYIDIESLSKLSH